MLFALLPLLIQSTTPDATPAADPASPPAFATVTFKRGSHRELGDAGPWFPERAARLQQGGAATVDCAAAADGVLNDCRIVSETPVDWGFGPASLRMAKERWMTLAKPYADQPHTPEGRVRVYVTFARPARSY